MSSEQDERFFKMFANTLPPRGTSAHAAVLRTIDKIKTPEIDDFAKKQLDIFLCTRFVVANNGVGFPVDSLLRYYVNEFNHRAATAGLYSMPSSFNFMEAFMEYKKPLHIFLPKSEINTLCSFADFLDWTTSHSQTPSVENVKNSIESNQVHLFSNTSNPDLLKFKCANSVEFSILSAAIVRDRSEMVVVLQISESDPGQDFEYNTPADRQRFKESMPFAAKQKENLSICDELTHERVRPKGRVEGYESVAMIRYDIENASIVDRGLYQDWGDIYLTFVDVVQVFGTQSFDSLTQDQRKLYQASVSKCDEYQEVFELCRHFALLPLFGASYADHTRQFNNPTGLKSALTGIKERRQLEKAIEETRVFVRKVSRIEVPRDEITGNIVVKVPEYGFEDSGYWQLLAPWEQGFDKLGLTEQGRTWVAHSRPTRPTQASHELKPSSWRAPNPADQTLSTFGYIYVMRSAQHDKDVFKVGLTTRDGCTRAKELTASTASIDQFAVMQQWAVSDCYKAEKEIHERLKAFRVNKKREFFKSDYRQIFGVIHEVVEQINTTGQ